MKILITGIHRSGTSAISHLLSAGTGLSLLDDPRWAVINEMGELAFLHDKRILKELNSFDIVKIPRALESIEKYMNIFKCKIIIVIRDPRDVWCSIKEALNTGREAPQTMLHYRYQSKIFTKNSIPIIRFADAYIYYLRKMMKVSENLQVKIIVYENFVKKKVITILKLCDWIESDCKKKHVMRLQNVQHGPIENKIKNNIIGIGRYKKELKITEKYYLEKNIVPLYNNFISFMTT